MPSTSPIVGDNPYGSISTPAPAPVVDSPDRLQHLEGELAELRETVARFAEMMIGEVKELRSNQVETPPAPVGDGSVDLASLPSPTEAPGKRPWLLTELLRDFGATVRMYLDPRYRVRRSTQMIVPLLLILFALNYAFFQYAFTVPILSSLAEKLGDVVLAILLYRVVSQELVRYRQVLVQLQAWQGYRRRQSPVLVQGEAPTTRLETE